MSKILDSVITINGKEYVLFCTMFDFRFPDLEIVFKMCLKSDLDKIKKKYPDFVDEHIYFIEPFCYNYEDLKEMAEEYYYEED